ncbi:MULTISPECIES: class I SAM-dependent methyltransferase [unclassified Variovorax]|jgi:methylase of polypeptide subunit release factors|uniref:methyltransferase n=1 Tax=unclassified Variovorax TaxID=663243 RepID=UPI000F7FA50D|nr:MULTISPECIES: class I SAM-dependent methyltransferase [unclassified Variovorax]RSZ47378.1 class I SAM-dependent methyltransferase [Variovorax sp. 553]RSZ48498.1 class I SAM-dependent methyltransferase [Variovorax sp. 679]
MLNAAGVLRQVAATGYRFTTVTPLTHQRVLARRGREPGSTLRDIFGWNLSFEAGAVPPELLADMERAGIVRRNGALLRSTVRIASLGDDLFFHSAYPTVEENAVFFGPDTSRFARFIRHALAPRQKQPGVRVLDVGCGSGAGGIAVARALAAAGTPATVVMNDINPLALQYTAVNAEVAGVAVTLAQGDALSAVDGEFDLIVSNPPYLDDAAQRAYRHGGTRLGRALSVRIAAESLKRLAPGGQLLLYTGVAMVDGEDPFLAEMQPLLAASGHTWSYSEIDPDVFGEELERPVYAHIDRIAAVGLVATRTKESA